MQFISVMQNWIFSIMILDPHDPSEIIQIWRIAARTFSFLLSILKTDVLHNIFMETDFSGFLDEYKFKRNGCNVFTVTVE